MYIAVTSFHISVAAFWSYCHLANDFNTLNMYSLSQATANDHAFGRIYGWLAGWVICVRITQKFVCFLRIVMKFLWQVCVICEND